jgi:hypothetical protein
MVVRHSVDLTQKEVSCLKKVGFLFDSKHKNNPQNLFGIYYKQLPSAFTHIISIGLQMQPIGVHLVGLKR